MPKASCSLTGVEYRRGLCPLAPLAFARVSPAPTALIAMFYAEQRLIVYNNGEYKGYKQYRDQQQRIGREFEFGRAQDPEKDRAEEERDKMADCVAKGASVQIKKHERRHGDRKDLCRRAQRCPYLGYTICVHSSKVV